LSLPLFFVFQLTRQEFDALRSQNVILADGRVALRSPPLSCERRKHIGAGRVLEVARIAEADTLQAAEVEVA
jgi:hypothetical protein